MKYNKIILNIVVLFLLLNLASLYAQRYGVALDGGRFQWRVEPKNQQARWDEYRMNAVYPGDFRADPGYTNLLHGGTGYLVIDKNPSHPWQAAESSGLSTGGPSGGVAVGDQNKTMRYAYPVLTVDGRDAGLLQDPGFIIDQS